MKADTKVTVVMCCQIVGKRPTAPSSIRFRRRPGAAALLTEPQTAVGVVYFLQIQPVNDFCKQKTKQKILFFFQYLLPQLFSHNFYAPFL